MLDYKLYHFSDKPFIFDEYHIYKPHRYKLKPAGLWLSVGDDWAKWCYRENYMLQLLKYRTEFTITDTSNICYLRTESDVDTFIDNYKYIYTPLPSLYDVLNPSFEIYTIHWDQVQRDYDGIFIDEDNEELYNCGFRSGGISTWLDSWDCLSGCVWNFDIVHQKESKEFNLEEAARRWHHEELKTN